MKTDRGVKPELALLVDGDQSGAEQLVKRVLSLETDWQVTARVCIRNWRSSTDQAAWDAAARECRMECIQHAPETRGKNATDIELTIRAMDLLHGSGYRAFCILSGDSDFRPLARRLERGGARVILETLNGQPNGKDAPTAKTATALAKAPTPKPKPTAPPKAAPPKKDAAPAPIRPAAPAKKEPDAVGFGRVVGQAHDECIRAGQGEAGAVPLVLLSGRIPPDSRKETFGYPKSRPMRVVVASLSGFAIVETKPGQHAVKRAPS